MSNIQPVNRRASVKAVYDPTTFDRNHVPAGHFHYYNANDATEGEPPAGMLFGCPCGCGELKSVGFRPRAARPSWEWDGNVQTPTLSPSINILQFDNAGNRAGEHWHGWLRNGEFLSV